MEKLIRTGLSLVFCSLFLCAFGQQPNFDINSQTVFKDKEGNRVSFETFIEWTSGTDYEMEPIFNDDKSLKEIVINKISTNKIILANEFAAPQELIERTPPRFEGYDMRNQFISLDNYKNKVVVLKFWFAACAPCIKEMPLLNNLHAQYRNNPDVVFLAPSLDDPLTVQASLQRNPFSYNVMPNSRDFAHSYNVLGYPTHIVINKKGTVEAVFQGVNHRIDEKLGRAIESAMNRRPNDRATALPVSAPAGNVVNINPNSVIVDKDGIIVPFEKFVKMMNEGNYELFNSEDLVGNKVVMIKEAVRN